MNPTIKSVFFFLLLFNTSYLFAQINNRSVENFFERQPYRIYYWDMTTKTLYPDGNSIETFLPVVISTNQNDSLQSNYLVLNSRIRLNSFITKNPLYDTTFFYFIPSNEHIRVSQILSSNGALIEYKSNNSSVLLSPEYYSSAHNKIERFESDILLYSKLQKENRVFIDNLPIILVLSAIYAYLGYAGYKDRNKEGFSGLSSLVGGVISAGVSLTAIIHSAIGFYNYLVNKSSINKIWLRIENVDY